MDILINGRTNIRNVTRDKQTPKETKEKLFHILDEQRKQLLNLGINLEDTKDKSLWFQ
jgi:cysteinyl-tRNA synthetase